MVEKKNTDYSTSAVRLCNPPEVEAELTKLHEGEAYVERLKRKLEEIPTYQSLQNGLNIVEAIKADIKQLVETYGSYQDVERGWYAVKQRRESVAYTPELVRKYAPAKIANFVIIEAVDAKAMDAMVKAGQLSQEDARQYGEVRETYATIIR